MLIRAARPEDAAEIADVHVRSWQAAYEHLLGAERLAGIDVERRRRLWEGALAERTPIWVAESEGRVVGFVSIGDSRDAEGGGEGELYSIYALPGVWGAGAGPGLMAAAREALRERYETSILWVAEDNPRARRFYEREGWTLDGGRKEDELLGVKVAEVRYRI